MTQPMSLTDDKTVEVMAGVYAEAEFGYALNVLTSGQQARCYDKASLILAALRAAGCEVVWWRPISAQGQDHTPGDDHGE